MDKRGGIHREESNRGDSNREESNRGESNRGESRETASERRRGRVPPFSPLLFRLFSLYARRYVARHFHALRLSREVSSPDLAREPLVVYLNHPSWWEPLIAFQLARHAFPDRRVYAPMEARALAQYRFFGHIGFFGIETGTAEGAKKFLRVSRAILDRSKTALWITPEGRFTDPRERPVRFRSGLGHLAHGLAGAVFLPLAVEYPFWEERFPEALARFGTAVRVERGSDRSSTEWTTLLESQLEAAQDGLAREARARDPAAFDVILKGRAGVGGVYDLWRALRARLRGQVFHPEHGSADSGRDNVP
jgi:1-acyl-sn-glycerol-3-phosphate acyltransferase